MVIARGLAPCLGAVVALGACSGDELAVRPVLDLPVDDTDADAFGDIDEITITVARAGSERDLVTQTFSRGEPLELVGAPLGDDLVIHLTGFDGGIPVAYGRTCAFSLAADEPAPAPHVFFSTTLKFARLGITPAARNEGRGASFLGDALFVGGKLGNAVVREVERFDAFTGQLATVGELGPRVGAVEAILGVAPPRLAVIGGQVDDTGAAVVELVDGERAIETITSERVARIGHTATSLSDGGVIVIGGHPPGGAPVGKLTELAVDGPSVVIRDLRAELAHPRTGHTATRLGDDVGAPVLVAGGLDASGAPVGTAELFKPLREELAPPATFAPAMVVPRSRHQAARMPDGSVLFLGGIDAAGQPVRTLELFSLDAGFVVVGELPAEAGVIDMTVTVLPDGRLLLAGGRTSIAGAATNTAYIARLDQLDGSVDVVGTDRLSVPRAGHQAALLCDGTVLVTGGTAIAEVAERYNPAAVSRR